MSKIDRNKYRPLEGYIALTDAAKILGKSPQNTYKTLKRRKIEALRVGSCLVILTKDLEKLR